MSDKSLETKRETKECINKKNSVDKNLEILKNRLTETVPGFDYKVTPEKKYRLIFNGHELKIDLKSGEDMVGTIKLIKAILDDYKKQGFNKKFPKFYEKQSLDNFNSDLKVDNNLIREDYHVTQGEWISKQMGSDMNTSNEHFANNVKWKMEYNTKTLAEFLNEIVKDIKL